MRSGDRLGRETGSDRAYRPRGRDGRSAGCQRVSARGGRIRDGRGEAAALPSPASRLPDPCPMHAAGSGAGFGLSEARATTDVRCIRYGCRWPGGSWPAAAMAPARPLRLALPAQAAALVAPTSSQARSWIRPSTGCRVRLDRHRRRWRDRVRTRRSRPRRDLPGCDRSCGRYRRGWQARAAGRD